MRQDAREPEIQMGLFQPKVELPKAIPVETKQTVVSLLVKLLQEAAMAESVTKPQGRNDD